MLYRLFTVILSVFILSGCVPPENNISDTDKTNPPVEVKKEVHVSPIQKHRKEKVLDKNKKVSSTKCVSKKTVKPKKKNKIINTTHKRKLIKNKRTSYCKSCKGLNQKSFLLRVEPYYTPTRKNDNRTRKCCEMGIYKKGNKVYKRCHKYVKIK